MYQPAQRDEISGTLTASESYQTAPESSPLFAAVTTCDLWKQNNTFDCGVYSMIHLLYLFGQRQFMSMISHQASSRACSPPTLPANTAAKTREWMWEIIRRISGIWLEISGTSVGEDPTDVVDGDALAIRRVARQLARQAHNLPLSEDECEPEPAAPPLIRKGKPLHSLAGVSLYRNGEIVMRVLRGVDVVATSDAVIDIYNVARKNAIGCVYVNGREYKVPGNTE
jgi:hypothetical protein